MNEEQVRLALEDLERGDYGLAVIYLKEVEPGGFEGDVGVQSTLWTRRERCQMRDPEGVLVVDVAPQETRAYVPYGSISHIELMPDDPAPAA